MMERDLQMDMYDRERQASALAAAGDVAEKINVERARTSTMSSTTSTSGVGEPRRSGLSAQLEANGMSDSAAPTLQTTISSFTPSDDSMKPPSLQWNISQGDQIGGLAQHLEENTGGAPGQISRGVSMNSNKDGAEFIGLSIEGGVDDMEVRSDEGGGGLERSDSKTL